MNNELIEFIKRELNWNYSLCKELDEISDGDYIENDDAVIVYESTRKLKQAIMVHMDALIDGLKETCHTYFEEG